MTRQVPQLYGQPPRSVLSAKRDRDGVALGLRDSLGPEVDGAAGDLPRPALLAVVFGLMHMLGTAATTRGRTPASAAASDALPG